MGVLDRMPIAMKNGSDTFAQTIYNKVLGDIVNQRLKEGDRISDKEIASELELSRTPVREALIMLERDGFVKNYGKDGFHVRKFTVEDIRDLYVVREALETMAVRLGAKIINEDTLSLLEHTLIQMEKCVEQNRIDEVEFLDIEFHKLVVSSCNVHLMSEICDNLGLLRASIKVRGNAYSENVIKYNQQHRLIYEALRSHDTALAETQMRNHIQFGKKEILISFIRRPV